MDIIFVGIGMVFFTLSGLLVKLAEKLTR